MSTTSALLSEEDIIVVASVSCIYGIRNPEDFHKNIIDISVNQIISRADIKRTSSRTLLRTTENLNVVTLELKVIH